jgi:uncharacterized DUF497 family protein
VASLFDWNSGIWPKCAEHGASKEQIESIFGLAETFIGPDIDHSANEDRWIAVGREPLNGRALFVVFTVRWDADGQGRFRPISARFMHGKEFRRYVQDIN